MVSPANTRHGWGVANITAPLVTIVRRSEWNPAVITLSSTAHAAPEKSNDRIRSRPLPQ